VVAKIWKLKVTLKKPAHRKINRFSNQKHAQEAQG